NEAMSAIPPLLGDKRTSRGEPISVAIGRVEMWRGGFRWNMLERSPGRACTHWKAPPCHGAHPEQTFTKGDRPSATSPIEISGRCHAQEDRRRNRGGASRTDPSNK